MSRSTITNQFFLNDGTGQKLPIATGTWVTPAVNIQEQRRLSFTIAVNSATGAVGDASGFTGTLQVQGTDELAQCYGATGTPQAGSSAQPGQNGYTGALYWQAIPSGTVSITNATSRLLLSFSDVGVSFVRLAFNQSATGSTATGSLGGSGTWAAFLTAKNT